MKREVARLAGGCLLWALLQTAVLSQTRPAWTDSRFFGSPDPPPPYRVEPAFPSLEFRSPLDLCAAPGDADRLFLAQQDGKIFSFPNDPRATEASLVADLKAVHPDLTALYGIEFHPRYQENGQLFVCYVRGNDRPDGTFVSRFRLAGGESPILDPASEEVLIQWWSGGHNGGCLKFGPDGYLYISTGDGGAPSPPDPLAAGQDVSNLLSCILRIDVDRREAGRAYAVPLDNPLRKFDGARPEIWAYGFRNPWRMSFDHRTGDLWVGDVGWQLWEMIYRVQPGGNYGWAVMEGPQPTLPESPVGPTPILPPTVSHPHSEAASITGGYVYRGPRFPELQGVYVYGDFQSGIVWGLRLEQGSVAWRGELARTPLQLVTFGQGHDGELYLVDYQGSQQIYRLARNDAQRASAAFPRRLSETGLFASTIDQQPAPGVLEYRIQARHWADGTVSQRWMAVPGAEPVGRGRFAAADFPEGTVLAKTISIAARGGEGNSLRRLETQVLHREDGSWRPYTYLWNDEQTDAELAPAEGRELRILLPDEAAEEDSLLAYRVSSRAECQLCHNPWVEHRTTSFGVQSASPLAIDPGQWDVAGDPAGQLRRLVDSGWITADWLTAAEEGPRFADPGDSEASLETRVRSYLHVNCSQCHQEHAGGAATIRLSRDVATEQMQVLDAAPAQGAFQIPDARLIAPGHPERSVLYYRLLKYGAGRMPRLGASGLDRGGAALIRQWILSLDASREESAYARRVNDAVLQAEARLGAADQGEPPGGEAIADAASAVLVAEACRGGELSDVRRARLIAAGAASANAAVRELFESFLPASQRAARLGERVDPEQVLRLTGSAARGRELFFAEGASSCQNCHRRSGRGHDVGPDLTRIADRYDRRQLLTHLLEPSRFIDPKFRTYVAETTDGRVVSGLLIERGEREVRLRDAQGREHRFPQEELERLVTLPQSLMPDLLLRDLTPQQAADLLEYLASGL